MKALKKCTEFQINIGSQTMEATTDQLVDLDNLSRNEVSRHQASPKVHHRKDIYQMKEQWIRFSLLQGV